MPNLPQCECSNAEVDFVKMKINSARCTNDATILVTYGCVHEHIEKNIAYCLDHLKRAASGEMMCKKCFEKKETSPVQVLDAKHLLDDQGIPI